MIAIGTFLLWVDSGAFGAKITRFGTDGPWSHMALGFQMSNGDELYYEALNKQGFVGPRPLADVRNFVKKNSRSIMALDYTALTSDESEEVRKKCNLMVGTVGYGNWQLALMGLSERYHFPVPHSPKKVVCSEAVSRLLVPFLDLRDRRRVRHDMVNPNSAWRRWMEIKAGFGWVNRPLSKQ